MIPPTNCPYKEMTAPPCWNCPNYNADVDECSLSCLAVRTVNHTSNDAMNAAWQSETYEQRLHRYEHDRQQLLKLSKETLVDLIIKRPTMF